MYQIYTYSKSSESIWTNYIHMFYIKAFLNNITNLMKNYTQWQKINATLNG